MKTVEERLVEKIKDWLWECFRNLKNVNRDAICDEEFVSWVEICQMRRELLSSAILADKELIEQIVKERVEVDRDALSFMLCEHTPSIAKDSGLPEWCKGELDEATSNIAAEQDKILRVKEPTDGEEKGR